MGQPKGRQCWNAPALLSKGSAPWGHPSTNPPQENGVGCSEWHLQVPSQRDTARVPLTGSRGETCQTPKVY